MVPVLSGTGPGTAVRLHKLQGREGKGREGREGKGKGRRGSVERKGTDLRRGWIDTSMDREERKRSNGGREGGLGSSQNQKKEYNERVVWTTVVTVCFRTW